MKCIKTYLYVFSEDELKGFVVEAFNKRNTSHCPITKSNVRIEFDKQPYCEPTPIATIEIDEEGEEL